MMENDYRYQDEGSEDFAALLEEDMRQREESGRIVQATVVQKNDTEILLDINEKVEGVVQRSEFTDDEFERLQIGDTFEVFNTGRREDNGFIRASKQKADQRRGWDDIVAGHEAGEVFQGTIIDTVNRGFTVDINGVRAFLPLSQVDLRQVRDNSEEMRSYIGLTDTFKVINLSPKRHNVVVSRRAWLEEQKEKDKQVLVEKLAKNSILPGVVKNITEYGVFVDLGGLDGLLHITDISWGRVSHPSAVFSEGQEIEVMVLDYNPDTERVSLGYKQKTEDPWDKITERYVGGDVVKGRVVSFVDYGAFVEIEPGIEGLIHISEMSWTSRVRSPSQMLKIDDEVEVRILDIDSGNRRLSLSLRAVRPNPWDVVGEKYPVGSIVKGKIKNITEFGAFLGLDEGVDGLIHISDMSWSRSNHPSEIIKVGDEVEAKVLAFDRERERLSLGLKQLEENPWDLVEQRYPIDSLVRGAVVNLTDFGAFVKLDDGVEGLLHVSEISHDRIERPSDVLSIGQEIEAKVIKMNKEDRRIGLSMKDMEGLAEFQEHQEAQQESTDSTDEGDSQPE
ncbi:30S ribosomal protein S1 [Desulfurispira natronophila]|uniref:Small ribosomal subunit protein bS1 n=1 Tax=Desulfurispira natronophila TaxID=682562 RepID=A0A7W7Y481_9BACT|nr:30S ribosomal protein S1 [Desulfurispira natronophila]MBB5021728.1 small subunit ribosomal protein S1 [Desulfurispira natronophila]